MKTMKYYHRNILFILSNSLVCDLNQLKRKRSALLLTIVVLCQEIMLERIPEQNVLVSSRLIFKFSCFFFSKNMQVLENYPCVPKISLD